MSLQSQRNTVSRLQKEVADLRRQISNEQSKAASKQSQIGQIERSIRSSSSEATIRSKMRQFERYSKQLAAHTGRVADLERRLADKQKRLHAAQEKVATDEDRDRKRVAQANEKRQRESLQYERAITRELHNQRLLADAVVAPGTGDMMIHAEDPYDAFICHASEDKNDFVRPLVLALEERGMRVWYDETVLRVGDSLRQSIDKGLAKSRFGIVVLSSHFFEKNWTQYELDGLVSKEMTGSKVVLPLWHKVNVDEVRQYSPTLADRIALNSSVLSVEQIAEKLVEVLGANA